MKLLVYIYSFLQYPYNKIFECDICRTNKLHCKQSYMNYTFKLHWTNDEDIAILRLKTILIKTKALTL